MLRSREMTQLSLPTRRLPTGSPRVSVSGLAANSKFAQLTPIQNGAVSKKTVHWGHWLLRITITSIESIIIRRANGKGIRHDYFFIENVNCGCKNCGTKERLP